MSQYKEDIEFHGTTILSMRDENEVVIAGDGQITIGNTILKKNAIKVRKIGKEKNVIIGFAGSTADAITLSDKLETKVDAYNEDLQRACVELAKEWRTDKMLRKLEALIIVADKSGTLLVTGIGDVIKIDDGIIGIGSGGMYAQAAAKALHYANKSCEAKITLSDMAEKSLIIASDICIYTSDKIIVEKLSFAADCAHELNNRT